MVINDSFREATWVAIHNGGGVGWYEYCYTLSFTLPVNDCFSNDRGEMINGGFGLVLD